MKIIEAYSTTHFLIVAIILIIAFSLALLCNHLRIKSSVVICVSAVILIAFEIMKQLLLTYVRNGHYSWSDFPFQLCSTPMYLCIVYLFFKLARPTIEDYLMVFGPIGAIAAFAVPYSSFYNYLLLTIQSLAWHGILLFLGLFFLIKKRKSKALGSYRNVGLTYVGLAMIAILLNMCFFKVSGGDSNMFFLGPGYPQITILDYIYEHYGWVVESIIMIAATTIGGWIFFRLCLMGCFHKNLCSTADTTGD